MHGLRLLEVLWLEGCLPHRVHHLLVVHLLEDTIAPNHNEIVIILDFECSDLRDSDHHGRVAAVPFILGFDVSNRARH